MATVITILAILVAEMVIAAWLIVKEAMSQDENE